MRIVLAFLVVLVNSTYAYAAPVAFYGGGAFRSSGPAPSPQTITVRLGDSFKTGYEQFQIAGITPDDVDTTWTVTEDNAASFGFDWQAAQELIGSPADFRIWTPMNGTGKVNGGASLIECRQEYCVIDFALDRIEVTLDEFFSSPIGSRVKHSVRVVGEGQVVPEPSTLALVALALCGLCSLRLHRN